jgi:hypothetical protein
MHSGGRGGLRTGRRRPAGRTPCRDGGDTTTTAHDQSILLCVIRLRPSEGGRSDGAPTNHTQPLRPEHSDAAEIPLVGDGPLNGPHNHAPGDRSTSPIDRFRHETAVQPLGQHDPTGPPDIDQIVSQDCQGQIFHTIWDRSLMVRSSGLLDRAGVDTNKPIRSPGRGAHPSIGGRFT